MPILEDNDPRWVLGYVDSYGAVHARVVTFRDSVYKSNTHTESERLSGRPFRWDVSDCGFGTVLEGCDRLDEDDVNRVLDWLTGNGFKTHW